MGRNRNGKYSASNRPAMTAATALKSVAMTTFLFRSVSPGQNQTHQKAAITSGDLEGFHELDTRFHRRMTEVLGLARVGEVLDPIRTHLERVRRTLLPEPGRLAGTFREHEAIYRAIAAREPDRAKGEMANHLDRVSRELHSFVARHPGFFEE